MAEYMTIREVSEAVERIRREKGDDFCCSLQLITKADILFSLKNRGITEEEIEAAGYNDNNTVVADFFEFYDRDESYGDAINSLAERIWKDNEFNNNTEEN